MKDRIAQQGTKIVLEPIFEADFLELLDRVAVAERFGRKPKEQDKLMGTISYPKAA